ncbi:3-deoxy-D-manno-octulosonic acid transferase [Psychromonas sp. psych-6C06]|uniref:lipid IV(A) 3-deoxy-D-manno-octulosonic acid transferase n=1 Tax=Psychromonas sp. psych-6C06 TaxID=2058089 RepID=UPI000C34526C|nr:lipid IV(A) 3-deoxy-D-manno-octulosonic acid transferase [Psychromonas sp. psych-6C06]PKF61268.1 3-deoxy-D-manno-octulosonic acid transferase [Psychromonas sp. psych-6C06]
MLIGVFYTLLLFLASPLLLFKLYQKKQGKPSFGKRWKEHFGVTPVLQDQQCKPIWIHAVSVGESIAITPLVKKLKKQHPTIPIVVTTTTSTGAAQINKLSGLVEHRYMPIDFAWCVKGFIKKIKPQLMIIVETELWPNTLRSVNKKNIPVIVINARLSARSAKRYQQFNFIWKIIACNIDHFLCLHNDDASRFIKLGVNSKKITVTGSLKYDIDIPQTDLLEAKKLRLLLGKDRPIIIAASTHKGEDEIVLDAFKALLKDQPNALLVIVPRHPERFHTVEKLCTTALFSVVRRTSNHSVTSDTNIYLADTMGEMLVLIGAADIVLMGGSLIGDKVGGHNFIEPAALQKPILSGPSYYNFADLAQQLLEKDALKVCSASTLSDTLKQMIKSPIDASNMGKNALRIVQKNQGALRKSLLIIENFCESNE